MPDVTGASKHAPHITPSGTTIQLSAVNLEATTTTMTNPK